MTESNFELLQDNKEKVLAFTKSIIEATQQQPANKYPPDITTRLKDIKVAFDKEDYGQAISLLDELKDNRVNITWKTSKDLGNGTACRIRDARNLDPSQSSLDAPEKYQMQLINQFRGAVDLINLSGQTEEEKTKNINKLKFIISKSLEDPNIGSGNIRKYNTQMLSVLEDAQIDNAADRLKFACEMSNFKDSHYHIVTLSRVNDPQNHEYTAIEADIMLNGLTDTQAKNYNKIAKYESLQNSVTGVKWFDAMDDLIKKELLSKQAAEIATGHKVIPAQFLSNLEGVRNGYMKVTAISNGEEGKDQPIILSENIHCGAPVSKMKNVTQEEKDQIVTRNIEQLQTYLAKDQVLNINILASSTPLDARGENFIIDQIKSAQTADSNLLKVSVSPINRWRWLGGGRDTEVFQDTLKTIGTSDFISEKSPNISKYLASNRNPRIEKFFETITLGAYKSTETKARKELEQITDLLELKKILSVAIDAKKLAQSYVLFSNSENINLELSSKMNQIENAINLKNGILKNIPPSYPVTVECCKSGKDRTGYVMLNNTVDVINTHLGLLDNSKPVRTNKDKVAQAGHAQEMAGIQGGTIGCHSLKTNPEFGLNKSDQHLNEVLGQKSSHFNSTIKAVDDATKKAEIIAEFKNAYSDLSPTATLKTTPDQIPKAQTPPIKKSLSFNSQAAATRLGNSLPKDSAHQNSQTISSVSKVKQPTSRKRSNSIS